MNRIAELAVAHHLTGEETQRLISLVEEYPDEDREELLAEELRCIYARRSVANLPPLTKEFLESVKRSAESMLAAGLITPQE